MSHLLFRNGNIVLPDKVLHGGSVLCSGGTIAAIANADGFLDDDASPGMLAPPGDADVIDLEGRYLAPGFIDIHVHGGDNRDFMDGTVEAVRVACRAHLRHGTTTIFPTTTTGSPDQIREMISTCQAVAQEPALPDVQVPHIEGVHLYGPYFAEDKVGCHDSAGRRNPHAAEYEEYFGTGFIRIATCAAELPGALQFYQSAQRNNCFITCGHSNSSWQEMQVAFDNGMRHVDHFWCAMSSVPSLRQRFNVPMQASMAEFVLMNSQMSTEVIADGKHLSPELLEFAFRMIGPHRLCLVTDCNRALDCPPGLYRFGNENDGTWMSSDGEVGWSEDGKSLASSIVGMDHMVRHMFHSTNADLPSVIRMAGLTPAERTGISNRVGSITRGKQADLLILDEDLRIQRVYIGGVCKYSITA